MKLKKALRMMRVLPTYLLACFVTCLSVAGPVQAGFIHSLAQEQDYMDLATLFPSSGFIEVNDGSGFVFGGSGVLVAPNWVLTAAHVALAVNNNRNSIYSGFRFGTGSNFNTDRGMTYTSSEAYLHPTYSDLKFGRDLALIHFNDQILNIPVANLYEGPKEIGRDAYMVGHGTSGTIGGTDPQTRNGSERAGVNLVNRLEFGVLSPDFISASVRRPGFPDSRILGMLGGPGDSGGGWFYDINGQWQLAGVTSLVEPRRYNAITAAAFIDTPWVRSYTAVPEPGSLLLLTMAGARAVLLRRRKINLPE